MQMCVLLSSWLKQLGVAPRPHVGFEQPRCPRENPLELIPCATIWLPVLSCIGEAPSQSHDLVETHVVDAARPLAASNEGKPSQLCWVLSPQWWLSRRPQFSRSGCVHTVWATGVASQASRCRVPSLSCLEIFLQTDKCRNFCKIGGHVGKRSHSSFMRASHQIAISTAAYMMFLCPVLVGGERRASKCTCTFAPGRRFNYAMTHSQSSRSNSSLCVIVLAITPRHHSAELYCCKRASMRKPSQSHVASSSSSCSNWRKQSACEAQRNKCSRYFYPTLRCRPLRLLLQRLETGGIPRPPLSKRVRERVDRSRFFFFVKPHE